MHGIAIIALMSQEGVHRRDAKHTLQFCSLTWNASEGEEGGIVVRNAAVRLPAKHSAVLCSPSSYATE